MSSRAQALAARLPDAGLDALLVTGLVNVRYLTGYTGTNGAAVISDDALHFLTDFRYLEQAADEVDDSFARLAGPLDLLESVEKVLPLGSLRLGFEDAHLTVWQHRRLRELLPDRIELLAAHGIVEELRLVKDRAEVERISAATALGDEAYRSVLGRGIIGRTEQAIATALEFEMRERGAEAASFPAIVAAGPHGAHPHAKPRDVEIPEGQLVVIDWGCVLDGYCSDCTRTIAAGEPQDRAREIYALVLEAQETGLGAVTAGAGCRAVDATARDMIDAAGFGERFGHGLGHGVGLDVHESPRFAQSSQDVLASGNVVTIEPGVYLPGELGVRIEDLVVVTDDGCEILTAIDKQLTVVD